MRIHRLMFCSIGPYAQPQRLDFDLLSEAGVFLFTGPTGAGKSTVLDAISLALYNQPVKKRGERAEAVVSNHADLETHPPEVEMEFSVGEHRYLIHRRLSHSSYAKRGQRRLVARPGTVNLHRVQAGELIPLGNRQEEVARQIEDIVHLNREQFTKVMMLPQGEFAEFLTASSEERRQILERLFDTGRFLRVTELLRERAKKARAQFDEQLQHKERLENHLLGRARSALEWAPEEATSDIAENMTVESDFAEHVSQIQQHCAAQLTDVQTAINVAEQRREELTSKRQHIKDEQGAIAVFRNYERRKTLLAERTSSFEQALAHLTQHHEAMKLWADVRHSREAARRVAEATEKFDRLHDQLNQVFDQPQWLEDAQEVTTRAAGLEEDREALALAIAAEKSAEQLRQQLAKTISDAQQAAEGQQVLQDQHTELSKELAAVQETLESLPEQTTAISGLEAQRKEFAAFLPVRDALVQAVQSIEKKTAEHAARQRDYLAARSAHSDLLHQQYAQATLLLASQLRPGEPCAVCGSTDHPQPAVVDGQEQQLVTKADLARAKKTEEKAEAAAHAAEQHLTAAQLQEKQTQERYRVLLKSFKIEELPELNEPDLDLMSEPIDTAIHVHGQRLEELLETARAKHQERTKAESQQARLAAELLKASEDLERVQRQREGLQATAATLTEQLEKQEQIYQPWVNSHGELAAARAAASAQLTLLQELQRVRADLSRLQQDAVEAHTALTEQLAQSQFTDENAVEAARLHGSSLVETEERVQSYRAEEAQLAEVAQQEQCQRGADFDRSESAEATRTEQLEELTQDVNAITASLRDYHGRVGELTSFQRELAEGLQELQVLEDEQREELAEVTHATHVAAVADGSDNERGISLPIYVLAAKLEKVAAEASRHLMEMTDGRYEIMYDDERSGTAKAGLGLKISDSWTGQERGTRSLSGGESFMASLALALGLADVVQQESGGVSMETLFIDEGFGSLDSTTLDEVMKTIRRLFDYGRVVGLVSHVEDMKNDIPTQIRIAATAQGSTARVVTG